MRRNGVGALLALLVLCLSPGLRGTMAAKWKPANPAELAMPSPTIDKDADAEVLEWDVRIYDRVSMSGDPVSVIEQYLRVKVFTDRGRESAGRVELPVESGTILDNVEGRTIKKDGTIVELKNTDVFRRNVAKIGGVKMKAVSFVLPDVERGAILEYRWSETNTQALANYVPLVFQREFPIHLVSKHIKPLDLPGFTYRMRAQPFNVGSMQPPRNDPDGFKLLTLSNVPAYREEPYSLPALQLRPWVLIYYEPDGSASDADSYWKAFGRELYDRSKQTLKTGQNVREAAAAATAGATSTEEKLARVVEYCRRHIVRVDLDGTPSGTVKAYHRNDSAGDTLKQGAGTGDDMVDAVAALARAAGLDARVAAAPDRSEILHQRTQLQRFFLRNRIVAVRDGDLWRFLDPANRFDPSGHLRWAQELQAVLIPDENQPRFELTPLAPPEWSRRTANATLTLSEDGTLEGDMTVEYAGHLGAACKEDDEPDSPEAREKSLKGQVSERLPGAEISQVRIENVSDPAKPYVNAYHLRVPGYAQRAGSRLIVQPALLERGRESLLPSPTRTSPVYFQFPWSEVETVTITLPDGYEVEQAEAPPVARLAEIGGYSAAIEHSGRTLTFTRTFSMGARDRLIFDAAVYPTLKSFFDAVTARDGATVTLRKRAVHPD